MFRNLIAEGKPRPDFSGTDNHQVSVSILGEIQNPQFLRFLERVGQEQQVSFGTSDLIVLDHLQRKEKVPDAFKDRLPHLLEQGVVESIGRGKGIRYFLSRRFHSFLGKKGKYTRERGLDKETNKALLVKHIAENAGTGSTLHELQEVLPSLSRNQVQKLMQSLKAEGKISMRGQTRTGRWYPDSRLRQSQGN